MKENEKDNSKEQKITMESIEADCEMIKKACDKAKREYLTKNIAKPKKVKGYGYGYN